MELSEIIRESMAAFGGRAVFAQDQDYGEASHAFERSVRQFPEAVLYPESAADVATALRAAGCTITTQAGGHGASEDLRGSILLRLDKFDHIGVDFAKKKAVVGAGVKMGALTDALRGAGLVPPLGTSPDVSVVGLALGGGHSWISRAVGLAANTVRRVELVFPQGSHAWVDDQTDPELMSVLRGAGGLVGVVTAVEIDLAQAKNLTGGSLLFPVEDGPAVWRAARYLHAPDPLSVFLASTRMPDEPYLPAEIRGQHWISADAVSLDGDVAALGRVRDAGTPFADSVRAIDVTEIAAITNDTREPGATRQRSAFLSLLPDELIDRLLAWHRTDAGAPVMILGVRPLDGAMAREDEDRKSVVSTWGANWALSGLAPHAPTEEAARRACDALAELERIVAPFAVAGGIPTYLDSAQKLEQALSPESIRTIRSVRSRLGGDVIRPQRL